MMLYRNTPSVIIGRNQNPWMESDLEYIRSNNIALYRRFSGGGAVFHDLGNTNYSYMMPRKDFDRDMTASRIIAGLRSLGLDVGLNSRHDISIMGADGWRKCSGSAYKISKDRAYAHGTMLLNSRLENLGSALRAGAWGLQGNGVESVRSKVSNLQISHEDFCKVVSKSFGLAPRLISEKAMLGIESVAKNVERLESDEWRFRQTPVFTQRLQVGSDQMIATIRQGRYHSFEGLATKNAFDDLIGTDFVVDLVPKRLQQKS